MPEEIKAQPFDAFSIPLKNNHLGAAVFPNGRLFLIENPSSGNLNIIEIDPKSAAFLNEDKITHTFGHFQNAKIQTIQNKIILSNNLKDVLIYNIDLKTVEQRIDLNFSTIHELDSNRVVVKSRKVGADVFYIANLSNINLPVTFSTEKFSNPNKRIHTLCILSGHKVAVLTIPAQLEELEEKAVAELTIWEEEENENNELDWVATKSCNLKASGNTLLKKLNNMQLIQIDSEIYLGSEEKIEHAYQSNHNLSLINTETLSCHPLPPFVTRTNLYPGCKWEVINFKTLLLQCGEYFFLYQIQNLTKQTLEIPFLLAYPGDNKDSYFTLLNNGNIVFSKKFSKQIESHEALPDGFQMFSLTSVVFLLMACLNLSEPIAKKNHELNNSLPGLPAALWQLIREYCEDDFSVFIEADAIENTMQPAKITDARIEQILEPLTRFNDNVFTARSLTRLERNLRPYLRKLTKYSPDFPARLHLVETELENAKDLYYSEGLRGVKTNLKAYKTEKINATELLDQFKVKHKNDYKGGFLCGFFHKTNLVKDSDYSKLTTEAIYAHACKGSFFGLFKNRTRLVLEEMNIMDKKNDDLLIREFISSQV